MPTKKKKAVKKKESKCECKHGFAHSCNGGGIYCLGVIGAAIYFISQATGFWMGVLGLLKALVWPVFVVYGLLKFLGM